MRRFHLQDVTLLRPYLETAADTAIRAHRLRLLDAIRQAHRSFRLRDLEDRPIPDLRLHVLHHVNHLVQGLLRPLRQVASFAEHGALHQRIAWAHSDAMAAAYTAR